MQNRFFNENAFQYALDCVEKNPYEAKERYESYLNQYPRDYYARAYYILLLELIGQFDLAEKEYNYIEKMSIVDTSFNINKRTKGFKYVMALAKTKLLAYHEKYQELFDFYHNNLDLFDNRGDSAYLSYYCKFKLGRIKDTNCNGNSYRFSQVVNYDENRFIDHIKKHLADYNTNLEKPNTSIFTPDFPTQKIVEEIKKYIPGDSRLYLSLFDDGYHFKYDNCGRVNNKITDYFKVVCFHNTCNFITMCPVLNCEYLPIIDLNYLKEEDNTKIKKLTQIEKFNKKYHRN